MFINADMTIYSFGPSGYTRMVINDVFWEQSTKTAVTESGMVSASVVNISVPVRSVPDGLLINKGKDLAVRGVVETEINNTSDETKSASLKALKAANDVFTIVQADPFLFGSPEMQHYELLCK